MPSVSMTPYMPSVNSGVARGGALGLEPPLCKLLLIIIRTCLGLSTLSSPVYNDQIKFIAHALALAMQMGMVNVTTHTRQKTVPSLQADGATLGPIQVSEYTFAHGY